MSLTVSKFPDKTVNTTNVSKWSSVHHPIRFELIRKDEDVFITDVVSQVEGDVILDGIDVSGLGTVFNIGDSVYLEGNNGYATCEIKAVFGASLVVTIKVLSGQISLGVAFLNYANRLNYFAKTIILGVNEFGAYYEIGTSINKPNARGRVTVDTSSFLKSLVDYNNTFDYLSINKKDSTLGGRYNIKYSENWLGFEGSFSGVSSTLLRYFTNSAKQIQDLLGENMGVYVPFKIGPTPKANFLTDFDKPTYFPNFPFSLSFINSDDIYGIGIRKNEIRRNINNGIVSILPTVLSPDEGLGVNRLMLDGGYASNITSIDVKIDELVSQPVVDYKYVKDDYVADGYVEEKTGLPTVGESVSVDAPTI